MDYCRGVDLVPVQVAKKTVAHNPICVLADQIFKFSVHQSAKFCLNSMRWPNIDIPCPDMLLHKFQQRDFTMGFDFIIWDNRYIYQGKRLATQHLCHVWVVEAVQPKGAVRVGTLSTMVKQQRYHQRQFFMTLLKVAMHGRYAVEHVGILGAKVIFDKGAGSNGQRAKVAYFPQSWRQVYLQEIIDDRWHR